MFNPFCFCNVLTSYQFNSLQIPLFTFEFFILFLKHLICYNSTIKLRFMRKLREIYHTTSYVCTLVCVLCVLIPYRFRTCSFNLFTKILQYIEYLHVHIIGRNGTSFLRWSIHWTFAYKFTYKTLRILQMKFANVRFDWICACGRYAGRYICIYIISPYKIYLYIYILHTYKIVCVAVKLCFECGLIPYPFNPFKQKSI